MKHLTTTILLTLLVLGGCSDSESKPRIITLDSLPEIKAEEELPLCEGDLRKWTACSYTWADGSKYVGAYKDGKRHGQGSFFLAYGDKYVGTYKEGKQHGQGSFFWANGIKYVGTYKDGKETGLGTYTYSNGDKYVGAYKYGKRNGLGTYTYSNGKTLVGIFKDNKYISKNGELPVCEGRASSWTTCIYTYSNGNKYAGEWQEGKQHGQGTLTYSNGNKYVGAYKDGKKNGLGIYSFANGDVDEGEWKEDKRHGTFSLTRAESTSDKNVFSKGKYVGKGDDGLKILNNHCSAQRDRDISHSRRAYGILRGDKNWNIIEPHAAQALKTNLSNIEYIYKKCIR